MSSIWNNRISVSVFGEADGPVIGVTVDNLPAGEYIDSEKLLIFMARRYPSAVSSMPRIMSGIVDDRTTGDSLCAFLQNHITAAPPKTVSEPQMRFGNSDYTGTVRYRGFDDAAAYIHTADRLTSAMCFVGAVCAQILERRGIYTGAHILQIHNVRDNPFDPVNITRDGILSIRSKEFPVINDRKGWLMTEAVDKAYGAGESLGGIIECASVNVPAGIGSPIFDGLENNIAQLMFGIPDVKGLEFGMGFLSAKMVGSRSSDEFYLNDCGHAVTRTNHHGGILGGVSSGMPITLRVAIKPSCGASQSGDNKSCTGNLTCSVPYAVPCVEAAVNTALLSHMLDYPNFC